MTVPSPRDLADRRIVHVDMDAFYASVEQLDEPSLRGRPVIVGGAPNSRGVVCAASYEAREFGVRSAMASSKAHRLCPDGVFLPPRFDRYGAISRQVRGIFERFTPLIEPLSLDEAYLDLTEHLGAFPSATAAAEAIRGAIRSETGLTASAGVAPNKFLAKVASEVNKPDGLFVLRPSRVAAFLATLPVRKIPGIGKVTEARCHERGIRLCGDFLPFDREELRRLFGNHGDWFFDLARGVDHRPVAADGVRRSCSIEETYAEDLKTLAAIDRAVAELAEGLERRLSRHGIAGRTVTVKVKYADFRQVTRSRSVVDPIALASEFLGIALDLVRQSDAGKTPVRLLGIGLSALLDEDEPVQLKIPFKDPDSAG